MTDEKCIVCRTDNEKMKMVCFGDYEKNNNMRVGGKQFIGILPEYNHGKDEDYICNTVGKIFSGTDAWSGDKEAYPFGRECGKEECKGVCNLSKITCPSTCDANGIIGKLEEMKTNMKAADKKISPVSSCIVLIENNAEFIK